MIRFFKGSKVDEGNCEVDKGTEIDNGTPMLWILGFSILIMVFVLKCIDPVSVEQWYQGIQHPN